MTPPTLIHPGRLVARALSIAVIGGISLAAACSPELLQAPPHSIEGPDSASLAAGDAHRPARRPAPRVIPRRVAVGDRATCSLDAQDAVLCWGSNQSGDGFPYGSLQATSRTPVATGITGLTTLSAGGAGHSCGIDAVGVARCWGNNGYGQLGSGAAGGAGPVGGVIVAGGIKWRSISVGRISTCGVSTTGDGYCWGNNSTGSVGNDSVTAMRAPQPVKVAGGLTFNSVTAGWNHNCGISTTGEAYCWGSNRHGKLGIGIEGAAAADTGDYTILHRTPKLVSGGHQWVKLAVGSVNTCGITVRGEAYCWGYNGTGQLGDGTTTDRVAPAAVSGGHRFKEISVGTGFGHPGGPYPTGIAQAGANFTCAITQSWAPYCWGWNGDGQLGDGTMADSPVPVAVQGGLRLTTIATGGTTACGTESGNLWCWGGNSMGQLGDGTTTPSTMPVLIDFTATADTLTAVSITPTVAATYVGGPARQFAALVTGNSNTDVSWTATAPWLNTIDQSGLVTPLGAGYVGVTATSVGDATRSARATLIIDPAPLDGFTSLANGVGVPVSGATGSLQRYYIAGQLGMSTLRVQLGGASGNANLYVYAGNTPLSTMESLGGTTSQRICRPYLAGSNETCQFMNPEPRIYYVMVHASEGYTGANLTATLVP